VGSGESGGMGLRCTEIAGEIVVARRSEDGGVGLTSGRIRGEYSAAGVNIGVPPKKPPQILPPFSTLPRKNDCSRRRGD